MLFNSFEFIFVFLPLTILLFFFIARLGHRKLAITLLVLASLFYYGYWNPKYLALILFSILFNFYIGTLLIKINDSSNIIKGRVVLTIGVIVNLALIGYFKYALFFLDILNEILNSNWRIGTIVLPIGISFFTFQQIAYLVDVYKGKARENSLLKYSLFVSFFPQLIAGPIVHHKQVLPQFSQDKAFRPSLSNLNIGFSIFTIGLMKKVLIADNMALIATPVFDAAEAGQQMHFLMVWAGTFAYSLQLYFDFSGYSDMAIGLARMFGIHLPLNFYSPYRANNIIDFWRRWHMTLSSFLKQYLYIPLGGNRKGIFRRYLNLFLTMLIGGLWHGAGWTFVFWGGLHGIALIINHFWKKIWHKGFHTWWSRLSAKIVTFIFVSFAWVFFRAETFGGALNILKGMRNLPDKLQYHLGIFSDFMTWVGFQFIQIDINDHYYFSPLWLLFWLSVLWILPNTQEFMHKNATTIVESELARDCPLLHKPFPALIQNISLWKPTKIWAVVVGLTFAITCLNLQKVSEFIYFQF